MADGKKYFGSPLYSRYTHNLIHGKKNTLLHGLAVPDLDIMTEWTKIDEQCVGGIGYEDFISADGKLCKRVWYDGEEEIFEISE